MAATSFAYWYGRQYFSSQRAYQENPVKLKIKENKDYPSLWIQGIQGEWDNYKRYNIHLVRIPEGEERKKGTDVIFATRTIENFPQLLSNTTPQIQEHQRTPRKINAKKPTFKYIIFKLRKSKKTIQDPQLPEDVITTIPIPPPQKIRDEAED